MPPASLVRLASGLSSSALTTTGSQVRSRALAMKDVFVPLPAPGAPPRRINSLGKRRFSRPKSASRPCQIDSKISCASLISRSGKRAPPSATGAGAAVWMGPEEDMDGEKGGQHADFPPGFDTRIDLLRDAGPGRSAERRLGLGRGRLGCLRRGGRTGRAGELVDNGRKAVEADARRRRGVNQREEFFPALQQQLPEDGFLLVVEFELVGQMVNGERHDDDGGHALDRLVEKRQGEGGATGGSGLEGGQRRSGAPGLQALEVALMHFFVLLALVGPEDGLEIAPKNLVEDIQLLPEGVDIRLHPLDFGVDFGHGRRVELQVDVERAAADLAEQSDGWGKEGAMALRPDARAKTDGKNQNGKRGDEQAQLHGAEANESAWAEICCQSASAS